MPSIQFYADDADWKLIFERLAADGDIAVILPAGRAGWIGRRKWIARRPVGELSDGPYCLWHVPAGPLPLVPANPQREPTPIDDPFAGWTQRSSSDSRVPFFGSTPAVVTLGVQRCSAEAAGGIGQSSFGWVGNRYRAIGQPACEATEKWWRDLTRWVGKTAGRKITRWGNPNGPDADIWAFPSAYEKICGGAHRDANPRG